MKPRGVWIAGIVHLILLFMYTIPIQAKEIKCGDWAAMICRDYGCQAIGCLYLGGKITGEGLVMNQAPFKKLGFHFGSGPYKASFQRLNPGRYVISLQAMTRPNDRQEKLVRIQTPADAKYPTLDRPAPEPGKYTWNQAIEYDIEDQLGLKAHYEKIGENVSFIDLRVVAPKKLAELGFPLLPNRDTSHQLLYEGQNRWRLSSRRGHVGPMLIYKHMTWKTSEPGPQNGPKPKPIHPPVQVTGPQPIQLPRPFPSQPKPLKPLPPPPPPPQPGHPGEKVTMERNVERPGGDFKNFQLNRGDPGLCARECEEAPMCRAFTYYRPGLRGKKAFCSLKRVVTPKKMKAGCYSGVK